MVNNLTILLSLCGRSCDIPMDIVDILAGMITSTKIVWNHFASHDGESIFGIINGPGLYFPASRYQYPEIMLKFIPDVTNMISTHIIKSYADPYIGLKEFHSYCQYHSVDISYIRLEYISNPVKALKHLKKLYKYSSYHFRRQVEFMIPFIELMICIETLTNLYN